MVKVAEINSFLRKGYVDFRYKGEESVTINTMSNLKELVDHSICWIKTKKYASETVIKKIQSHEQVLVVCPFEIDGVNCIITDYPKGVFFSILNEFFYHSFNHGISDKATLLTSEIGSNVHIGANCYIGEDVKIGDNTIIHPNVSIIAPCTIGHDCVIFPGVVIGADGFGYYVEDDIPYHEKHFKGVVIGDYVDIGANTCIDRGLLTDTTICNHVKIDNLCHIGHNVRIEENCMIIAGTIICGSAVIGRNSYLAPDSVVLNQIKIGEKAVLGVNSAAIIDVKAGVTAFGTPAKRLSPHNRNHN